MGPPVRRMDFMPVVLSTSSRAACITARRAFMRLGIASGGSDAVSKERNVPLDVLILSCELTHILGRGRFPRLSDVFPSPPHVVVNPYLEIGFLVFGKQ